MSTRLTHWTFILIPCHVCFQKKPDWALEKDGKAKAGGESEDVARSDTEADNNNANNADASQNDKGENDNPPAV